MHTFKFDTHCGDDFQTVARKSKVIASNRKVIVEFDFNNITCLVDENTNTEYLYRDYANAHTMGWKTIGPKCEFVYDIDTEIELLTRKLANAKKRKADSEAWEAKEKAQRDKTNYEIAGLELEVIPEKLQDYKKFVETNSQDGYSKAVVEFGEVWAKLMQKEIHSGKKLADIAEETQKDLGYLGISGFQYGCVVKTLAHFWNHGEELRKWHNKSYGVSEEKQGVANPAVFTIGQQESTV